MNKKSDKWVVGFLGLMLTLPLPAAPVTRLGVPVGPVFAGESFDISVYADGVGSDEVVAFGFDLDYDAIWAFLSVAMGPWFPNDDSGSLPNTMVAGSIDPITPGPGGDNILLATLSFRSAAAGLFGFGIVSNLNDKNEGLILFSGPTADLTANTAVEVSAVPVPGSLALFMLGLAGLPLRQYRPARAARRA